MILIPSERLFALDGSGQRTSYDFDGLCEDLRDAFSRNGVCDMWLVNQFTLTVEERLRGDEPSLTEGEIDSLVSSVLAASGYADVSKTFMELRGMDAISGLQVAMRPWDSHRLADVLGSRLPLAPGQVHGLATRCSTALTGLGLQFASDEFIRELGIHLLHRQQSPAKETISDAVDMVVPTGEDADNLLSNRALVAYPIAPLFPRAQVAIDLKAFVKAECDEWHSELLLFGKLPELAGNAIQILAQQRKTILEQNPDFDKCPCHAVVTKYADFIETYGQGMSLRERRGFDKRLRQLLSALFESGPDFEIMLGYR